MTTRETSDGSEPSFRSSLLGAVEKILWIVAVILLGFVAWSWTDAFLFQQRSREALASGTIDSRETPRPETDGQRTDGQPASPALPAPGTPIGRLIVPRLDLDVVVAEGVSEGTLRRAVGRIPSSAVPGEGDNLAIAGHRDSFFRPLESIRPGDLVIFENTNQEQAYRVQWTRVVDPTEMEHVGPAGYRALTLVTCYPFRYIGNAPQRFIVRARAVPDPEGTDTDANRELAAAG
ncbi:MAG: class D sortase [Thermoanaerobaculia bacterium]|nr:class D sortase [Thermoanaerobaculia bacterium]